MNFQLHFHGVDRSDALAEAVEQRAERLTRFCDRIVSCQTFIEAPHHSQRHGNHYVVRIELALPGETLVAGRAPAARAGDEDAYQAVAHSFDVMERRLVDHERRRRQRMAT